jgi:large subunit ribosomal protein L10
MAKKKMLAKKPEPDRKTRPRKVGQVESIRERLDGAAAAILTDFRGLNVGEISQLRTKLRGAGAEYKVVKNTLLERAAETLGISGLEPYLQGPTAVAFSKRDPIAPARILAEYIRLMKKLEVKAGLVEGRVLTAEQVRALADLPSRNQLLAMAFGNMKAPMAGVASVLVALPRNLVYALDQLRQKQEGAA